MRGDQLLQLEVLEVLYEVLPEVAPFRVVAVAKNGLSFKVVGVVAELVVDVFVLGVEFVVLSFLGLA